MTEALTPGQLLARVMKEEGVSVREMAKRLRLPPNRVVTMLMNTRGFEPSTLEKLADAIPAYGTVWWRAMNEMAKAGRLFDGEANKESV